ncbi:hypothetical protein AND_000806 [Anopheles darlingi]|uniref:Uncharacterized protein n=1 Tax=Anopheles darlingi TaxID=43151 RepID=W5JW68_ANODA|nr:uncharacterized protein LOC125957873 [Anopheles darlingi]ETN67385.1 hypothetical protein AND_000806 [Anopheles darlingi]
MEISKKNAFFEKLKLNVTDSFDRLRKAVDMREKLLLRQLTVLVQQAQHITHEFDSIRFSGDGEEDLIGRIRAYGRYNTENLNIMLQKEPYENEDYILPSNDHDIMHKSCRQGADDERDPESEEIVVEFFNNRSLIREGAEMLCESIINLTLNESRELIDRTIGVKPTTDLVSGEEEDVRLEEHDLPEVRTCKIDPTAYRLPHRNHRRSSLSGVALRDETNCGDWVPFQGELHNIVKELGAEGSDDGCNNNRKPSGGNLGNQHQLVAAKTRSTSRDGDKLVSHSFPTPHRMIPKASQTDGLLIAATDSEGNLTPCKAATDKRVHNVGHLTMGGCGSTINLKNVTNLTINACPERLPAPTVTKTVERASATEAAENKVPSEEGSPVCGFYKRLITENKILRNHIFNSKETTDTANIANQPTLDADSSSASAKTSSQDSLYDLYYEVLRSVAEEKAEMKRKIAEKNHPSLGMMMRDMYDRLIEQAKATGANPLIKQEKTEEEAETDATHIQQWLEQIFTEPETEPIQNDDMLEFSKID